MEGWGRKRRAEQRRTREGRLAHLYFKGEKDFGKGQNRHKRKGRGQEEKEKSLKTCVLQSFRLVAENEEK